MFKYVLLSAVLLVGGCDIPPTCLTSNDESRGSSIMRVVKYAGKGYKISTEELSKVLEALYARAYPTEPVLSFLKQFRSPSGE